jgi:hypothetical protein
MILGFNKHVWGKHNLFIKLGGDILGFIAENFRQRGSSILLLFFSLTCFFILWGFNGYKEWIIQLN